MGARTSPRVHPQAGPPPHRVALGGVDPQSKVPIGASCPPGVTTTAQSVHVESALGDRLVDTSGVLVEQEADVAPNEIAEQTRFVKL